MRHIKILIIDITKTNHFDRCLNSQLRSMPNGRPIEKYITRRGQKMETSKETPFEKTNVVYNSIWKVVNCIAQNNDIWQIILFDQSDQSNVL